MSPRHTATALWLLAITPLALASAPFEPSSLRTAEQLRDAAAAGSGAYAVVEDLTTSIGPRLAGSEADHRAVAWMEAQLKAAGFDRVWREEVTFPDWSREHERAAILGAFAQPLVITALGESVGTGDTPLEAEVVRFATLADLRAAAPGSLRGKIAYLAQATTRARDGAGYGQTSPGRRDGPSIAASKGAAGFLLRSLGTSEHRFAHTGTLRYDVAQPRIPAAAVSVPDAQQLDRLLNRGPVRVRLDIATAERGIARSWNVIGEIRGREQPDSVVVIGGHLDSWDLGTGAIDDGAGIAITFDAARRIAALPTRPRRSIRFIAWAAEERSLLGARQHAVNLGADSARYQIGAESDFGAGRIYALRAGVAETDRPVVSAIGEVLTPLGIVTETTGGGPGPDLIPLVALGVPWAQLAQDGTDYFDVHHTPDDVLNRIDPKALDQQVAAYAVLAWLAAESAQDFARLPPPAPAAPAPAPTR